MSSSVFFAQPSASPSPANSSAAEHPHPRLHGQIEGLYVFSPSLSHLLIDLHMARGFLCFHSDKRGLNGATRPRGLLLLLPPLPVIYYL